MLPISIDETNQMAKALGVRDLIINLRSDWGSDSPDYSNKIKLHLAETQSKMKGLGHYSISHTTGTGGYAYLTEGGFQIGFDIELRSRCRPAVVNRVCKNPEELERARLPENLWVAKEAAFKCLMGPSQPKVISDIHIDQWTFHSQDLETFFIEDPNQFGFSLVRGAVLIKDDYCLALALCQK